jgi:hypothetical protein
MSIYLLF